MSLHPTLPDLDRLPTAEEVALARGVVWRWVALAVRHPDPVRTGSLGALAEALEAALGTLRAAGRPWPAVAGGVALARRAGVTAAPALSLAYTAVFGHGVKSRCPLYEGEYAAGGRDLHQPHELADVSAFYRAFGLVPAPHTTERVDFLGLEAEFCAFLCQKEAWALEHGDPALAAAARDGCGKFLAAHPGRWVPALADRLGDAASDAFYRPLAALLRELVVAECAALDVTPPDERLHVREPQSDPDACLSCPMGASAAPGATGAEDAPG